MAADSAEPAATAIEIIGNLAGRPPVSEQAIREALATPRDVSRHGDFPGRPDTRIFASDTLVVKLRDSLTFSARDSRRWVAARIAREQALGCYCPEKTWWLWHQPDGRAQVASATPRLLPLTVPLAGAGATQKVELLCRVLTLFFDVAARHDVALDEGLSNFALNNQGALYYLDDDDYPVNHFASLSASLAGWVRRFSDIPPADWQRLGENLRGIMLRTLSDRHALVMVAEQLRQQLAANEAQQRALAALIKALQAPGQIRWRPARSAAGASVLCADHPRRTLFLSDVHGNLPALNAVLAFAREQGIRDLVVLGDVVGYGPAPAQCIALLKRHRCVVLKGNHDHAVGAGTETHFSEPARWVIRWTRARLAAREQQWLDALPSRLSGVNWIAVHGAPVDRSFFNGYVYSMTREDNLDELARQGVRWCFHGHSHMPGIHYRHRGGDDFILAPEVSLAGMQHALICPGAVGQPRAGRPGIDFLVIDWLAERVFFHHLDYDVSEVEAVMRREGFPPVLATRLREGR